MKKSIFGKIGAAAVVLTLVTSSLVGGTFAKYVTEVNATATGTVANWNVTFSDTADGVYTNDTVFKLEGTGKEKKVIPGETGTFDIVINGDSADVDFDYTITFEKGTDLNNIAVKFYDVTDNNNNDITEAGLTQTIGMDDGNKTVTKKIKWELPSGENDAENLAGKDISYKIVMNATQKGVCESYSVNKVL